MLELHPPELPQMPRIGRGTKQADFQKHRPARSTIEPAGELDSAFAAAGQVGGDATHQLVDDLLQKIAPLRGVFEQPLGGELWGRPMRDDHFLRRAEQLIDPQEQSLAEPRPQAFPRQRQKLLDLHDAELS